MHFFTSINNYYLAKARVLAKSVKRHCPGARFSLILSDALPPGLDAAAEPFDEIITVQQLGVPVQNLSFWIFLHTVVELCTAVKGQALVRFLEEGAGQVVYLDPDIAVFDDLGRLEALLERHDVILTPHQTCPEATAENIVHNEITSLRYGTYNLGFLAVKNSGAGLRFARWWRDRLVDYCYDDIPGGLFTDQKWGDLAPALFDGVHVLRETAYNVSTWNLSSRTVTKKGGRFLVDGQPLQFYHFSGFDSGAQEKMLRFHGGDNPVLWELREWYISQQEAEGQQQVVQLPAKYNFFDNGEKVTPRQRSLLRQRRDLYDAFKGTDPYAAQGDGSYYAWCKRPENQPYLEEAGVDYQQRCAALQAQLGAVLSSRSWKCTAWLRRLAALARGDRA